MPEQSYLGDTVRLDYHENAGGFLSAGATWRAGNADGRLSARERRCSCSARWCMAIRYQWSRLAAAGLVLFVAGGLSNLIDRLAMGSVIDFLNVGIGPFRTGIFNVADVAIMAGVALLLVDAVSRPAAQPLCNAFSLLHTDPGRNFSSRSADKTFCEPQPCWHSICTIRRA